MTGDGDHNDWCGERLADPSDDLYYAVLFSPRAERGNVRAIAALFVELEATVSTYLDMHVARTKLAWWRDELQRLRDGEAAHPATRILSGGIPAGTATALEDLVTGMELILLEGRVTDLATAQMHAERGSARLAAALNPLFPAHAQADQSAVGTAIGLARLLEKRDLPDAARRDIAGAARDLLAGNFPAARSAPPPLSVLASLAWRAGNAPESGRRPNAARVFTAWRAARGRLPRRMVRNRA